MFILWFLCDKYVYMLLFFFIVLIYWGEICVKIEFVEYVGDNVILI